MRKKINKFYVGANHIAEAIANGNNDAWTHPTLDKAIAHAKQIMEDEPERDAVIVIQIVRIVRRKSQPVIIERV